jgi:WD40 repeat protein
MRTFLIALVLGVLIAGGAAYLGGLWDPAKGIAIPFDPNPPNKSVEKQPFVPGDFLYTPAAAPVENGASASVTSHWDPIVIPASTVVYKRQEISTKQEGKILFVGKAVGQPTTPNPDIIPVVVPLGEKGKEEKLWYRLWNEQNIVEPGDMVAYLDPALALNEVFNTRFKLKIAQWELKSAAAATGETHSQYLRTSRMAEMSPSAVAAEELSMKKFVWIKHQNDEKVKENAIDTAKTDAEKAEIILGYHVLRNETGGRAIIKTIYKHTGETVKPGEAVLTLQNIDVLRAEGLIGAEYLQRLQNPANLKVSIEPIEDSPPLRRLEGHSGEVTSVAVSGNRVVLGEQEKERVIVASSGNKVLVWTPNRTTPRRTLTHPEMVTVQVVACSPPADKKHNWCLTGASDGSVRLWDLDDPKDQPKWVVTGKHAYGVTALAFSPDGQYFATGGEDNLINLWDTATGEVKYPFDENHGVEEGHQGAITALHFTPQCTLVSAARDNTLRVWELHQNGVKLVSTLSDRGGTVGQLGVSQDGRYMLFDKGRKLQLLSGTKRTAVSELNSGTGGTSFETLALFSPDAYLMLTAGGPEGRLELWKTPADGGRGMEVRQWVTKEHSPVTSAAFAPADKGKDPAFAVSGAKDGYVYVWGVPSRQTVEHHAVTNLPAPVVERTIEGGNQARIGVFVRNPRTQQYPDGRFIPGGSVNLVIEPR